MTHCFKRQRAHIVTQRSTRSNLSLCINRRAASPTPCCSWGGPHPGAHALPQRTWLAKGDLGWLLLRLQQRVSICYSTAEQRQDGDMHRSRREGSRRRDCAAGKPSSTVLRSTAYVFRIQNHDFMALWPDKVAAGVPRPTLLPEVAGHNHISLPMSLSLGDKEDAWTETLLQWMRDRC